MSTSPGENPGPGVVIFTACGDAALDHLAASLAAECDGSPTSIADLLAQVLEADIEDLAGSLSQATHPPERDSRPSRDIEEVGPESDSPDGRPAVASPPGHRSPAARPTRPATASLAEQSAADMQFVTPRSPPGSRPGPAHVDRRVGHAAAAMPPVVRQGRLVVPGSLRLPPDDPGGGPSRLSTAVRSHQAKAPTISETRPIAQ